MLNITVVNPWHGTTIGENNTVLEPLELDSGRESVLEVQRPFTLVTASSII